MQSSVAYTEESRRAGRSSIMGLVGQPILQEENSVPSSRDFNDQVPEDVTQKSHATAGQEGSTLSMSGINACYQKGANSKLDKEYDLYKTMRLWRGNAMSRALSEEEIDVLVCLERKEREMKLSVQDVSTLTEFSGRISLCRQGISREKTRIREEREREKLREAAKKGCSKAKRKLKNQKVAGAKRSAKYRQKQKKKARA